MNKTSAIKVVAAALTLVLGPTGSAVPAAPDTCHFDITYRIEHPPTVKRSYDYGVDAWFNRDYATAVSWWQRAANDGVACAQWRLGWLYQIGDAVEQNYATAAMWYRKAADQGIAEAQKELAYLYHRGTGVPEDRRAAATWFEKAADQGDVEAQNRLGQMYWGGDGVLQDYVLAHAWFNLAAAANELFSADAAINRDRITLMMTPAQLAEAQRLAREWRPK